MKHSAVPLSFTVQVEPLGPYVEDMPPCVRCGAVLGAHGAVAVTVGDASVSTYTAVCAECGLLV